MASRIVPTNIDGTFPVAGQDNSSQGFRDNFTNIKNNFTFARNEISDLQDNVLLKSALPGTTLNNDLAGTQLVRPQLKAWTQSLVPLGNISGTVNIDFSAGNFQKLNTAGDVTLSLINWPSSIGSGALGYGLVRVWIVVELNPDTGLPCTVTLPTTVETGIDDIAGAIPLEVLGTPVGTLLTFDTPGNYVFDFSSIDGGDTFLIFDVTRNRVQFRDPSFYFNDAVSPTFLIGFQDALPLALTLATGNDTLQLRGSQTNYAGVLEHGNEPGIGINSLNLAYAGLGGNANVAGYSVGTSRAYVDSGTGLPVFDANAIVQSNDYVGYVNFLGATGNPANVADLSINEFGTIRGFVNGSSLYSPGGNLVVYTKGDYAGPTTGNLTQALSIENDQSLHLSGNLFVSNAYVPSSSTSGGAKGQISFDSGNVYICLGPNNWKVATLSSF